MKPKKPIHNDNTTINNNKLILISNIDNDDISIVKLVKTLQPELKDITMPDIVSTNILYYIDLGYNIDIIVKELKIELSYIELLKINNALFSACYSKLEKILIDNKVMNMITNNNNSDNINMFAIKGYRPEFRDNYLPQIQGVSTITINLEGIGSLDINAGKIAEKNPIDITNDNINE